MRPNLDNSGSMKKIFLIFALVSLCLQGYCATPKEYFESEEGEMQFIEDMEVSTISATPEVARYYIDSCLNAIRLYVYNEVLPTKEPNSLEEADVLLRWLDFSYYLPEEEQRAVAQRVKAIVLPIEGKRQRYKDALSKEIGTFPVMEWRYDYAGVPLGADTAQVVGELIEEKLACYHHITRPIDSDYLGFFGEYITPFLCRTKYCAELKRRREAREKGEYYSDSYTNLPFEYYKFAALWRDLLKWDSISQEEYRYLCDSVQFYTGYFEEEAAWHCLDAASYYRSTSYPDFVDIALAHRQIAGKVYGVTSPEYLKSADLALEALGSASFHYADCHDGAQDTMQYTERAQTICEQMLQSGMLTTDSAYYWWQLYAYQSQLSAKGPTKKLGKQIDQTAKNVLELSQQVPTHSMMDLYNQYLALQVDHALLANDYKRAEKVLAERWKQLPPYPEEKWDAEGKHIAAMIQTGPCAQKYFQLYMIKGDYENAFRFFNVYMDLVVDVFYDFPQTEEEKLKIAEEMNGYCRFPGYDNCPYFWHLQKRLEEQLQKWSGFRPFWTY